MSFPFDLPPAAPLRGLLFLVALAGGALNAVAGGGMLLAFPILLGIIAPISANATCAFALFAGSLSSVVGYRAELGSLKKWLNFLVPVSLIGSAVGAFLLTHASALVFVSIAPWLILGASLIFLAAPYLNRAWDREPRKDSGADAAPAPRSQGLIIFLQFLIAIYGGYFGAGIGILMLALMNLAGMRDIHRLNATKAVLSTLINAVAVVIFIQAGYVNWSVGIFMALGALVGGFVGARYAKRLDVRLIRALIGAAGVLMALRFFL